MDLLKRLSQKNSDFGAHAPVKIAFLGDSVTHGCFEIYKGPNRIDVAFDYDQVYHTKLRKLLSSVFPAVPVNIINAGVSGGSAKDGLERVDRDIIASAPDLAVVCFGLNDVLGEAAGLKEYTDALQGIFKKLKASGIETIFMTPNMMNTYVNPEIDEAYTEIAEKTAELQNSGMLDKYIDGAREVCKKEQIPVCDCYKKWKHLYEAGTDVTALLSNRINHPTREMHMLFAASLFEMICFSDIN